MTEPSALVPYRAVVESKLRLDQPGGFEEFGIIEGVCLQVKADGQTPGSAITHARRDRDPTDARHVVVHGVDVAHVHRHRIELQPMLNAVVGVVGPSRMSQLSNARSNSSLISRLA